MRVAILQYMHSFYVLQTLLRPVVKLSSPLCGGMLTSGGGTPDRGGGTPFRPVPAKFNH